MLASNGSYDHAEVLAALVREVRASNERTNRRFLGLLLCQCGFVVLVVAAILSLCASIVGNGSETGVDAYVSAILASPEDRLLASFDEALALHESDGPAAKKRLRVAAGLHTLSFLWDYRGFLLEVSRSPRVLRRLPEILAIRHQMLKASRRLAGPKMAAAGRVALERVGEMLTELFLDLRGVWPKVAQIVSMRPDVIKWEVIRHALAKSHDACKPKETTEVAEILEREVADLAQQARLGACLGSGSIGQVHLLLPREGAVLPGETELVAKVSFNEELWKMEQDFRIMEALGSNSGTDEVSQLFRSIWLFISNSIEQIEGEFNLTREAKFTKRGAQILQHGQEEIQQRVASEFHLSPMAVPTLAVPAVVDVSSSSVLILQKVDGIPLLKYIDSLEGGERESVQLALYGTIFVWIGWMIFSEGFYHGDPHPGQFLVDPIENRLWILDWGLSQRLSAEQTRDLHELYDLMNCQYNERVLKPRILQVAPAVVEYLAGRLVFEKAVTWAVAEIDAEYRRRVARVMRRMGFRTQRDSDLTLTLAAFGFFDTNVAMNDVEKLNKGQGLDSIVSIPGEYLVIMRIVATIAGYSRRLADSAVGAGRTSPELSNVRLWHRYVRRGRATTC